MELSNHHIEAILFGIAVGDALGVPVEFKSREFLKENHLSEMHGFGTHHQPKGTWSDDSSLTFCLADSLLDVTFSTRKLADRFINWLDSGYWTPHGHVFDIGNTTRSAIEALRTAANPEDAGGSSELDNGNGSLMRILPLVISTMHLPLVKLYEDVKKVSSLTHAHIRSINCCFYYIVFARQLIYGHPGRKAYQLANHLFSHTLQSQNVSQSEMRHLSRILGGAIFTLEQHEIRGSGYVVHSLEASLWCLLTSNSYEEAVLKAINLGEDTDTTGAITGGIAALYFGFESIPTRWINVLARKKDIEVLSNNLCSKYIHPIRLTDIPSPDDMPGALEFSHKYFGYLSTIEETSEVSQEVQRRIEINDTDNLKMVDLGTCLFFYFRMIRHVGDDPDKEWVNTLLGLMKRHIYLLEHANDLISQSSSK